MPAPDGAIERKLIDLRHPLSSLEARAQAGGDRAALDRILDRRSVGDVDRGADIADRPLARDIADVAEDVDALCHARAGGEAEPRIAGGADAASVIGEGDLRPPSAARRDVTRGGAAAPLTRTSDGQGTRVSGRV